ncbi:5-methylcytosine restriction system specificity protein McrC [Polyangium spumosum]|uniref:5-methylcytosine restriction system specificity protein McrC n=1 Tax=Polyangium spumosum TaxID=889282 RepID=UPI001478CD21
MELSRADWDLADALAKGADRRLEIDVWRGKVRVRALAWVGLVRFEQFDLHIVPKAAGGHHGLVEMIERTTGIDALRRTAGIGSLDASGTHLFDLFALLLAEASEHVIRRGILSDYVEREEDLGVVRGRILVDRQILRRYGRVDRVECRFDERDQDIPENKLLALALASCARRADHPNVRRRVRHANDVFKEVCSTEGVDSKTLLEGMSYHRVNEHYRDAHEVSRIILEGLGVDDVIGGGETSSFAFMMDMNRLFERFVWRLVEELLAGRPCHVRYQRSNGSILWNGDESRTYANVVPDIVVERTDGERLLLPIDAKYKLLGTGAVETGDLYQAFLYAYGHGRHPCPRRALLVHPASTDKLEPPARVLVRDAQTVTAAELLVISLPIVRVLAELREGAKGPACSRLIEALGFAVDPD